MPEVWREKLMSCERTRCTIIENGIINTSPPQLGFTPLKTSNNAKFSSIGTNERENTARCATVGLMHLTMHQMFPQLRLF